ncbi:MAG: imidazole glycerol phosphate synthase subunit HisH [Myxococcota bacterium]|nr:imidazole glycerol phosphate synthase subunit HisH [Myxococcota bacterium]
MIAIVNYGLGNVQALVNIYKRLNIPAVSATTVDELRSADRLILPGVGSFDWAMSRLDESGMRATLDDLVLHEGRPVLGICVGLQMMARSSEEGALPGLGWIDAEVRRFDETKFTQKTHLPHMGWNEVVPSRPHPLFREVESPMWFYFLHSYYFVPSQPEDVLAQTDYNGFFASSAGNDRTCGVQFHPEKSHGWGVQVLANFSEL